MFLVRKIYWTINILQNTWTLFKFWSHGVCSFIAPSIRLDWPFCRRWHYMCITNLIQSPNTYCLGWDMLEMNWKSFWNTSHGKPIIMDNFLPTSAICHLIVNSMEDLLLQWVPLITPFSLHWDSCRLCRPSMTLKAKVGTLLIPRDIFGQRIHRKRPDNRSNWWLRRTNSKKTWFYYAPCTKSRKWILRSILV